MGQWTAGVLVTVVEEGRVPGAQGRRRVVDGELDHRRELRHAGR